MENQNNLTTSLFRFVTLRMPELTSSSAASNSFIAQVAPAAGTMYGLVQTYGSLPEAAEHFTPYASDAAMRATGATVFSFADWLAEEGAGANYTTMRSQAVAAGTLTDAALKTLWDNLFYQMGTGESDHRKEVIMRAISANNLAAKMLDNTATTDNLAELRAAKIIIPKEIVAVAPETTTPSTPATFRGSKGLIDCLDVLVARDTARRYEQAISELTVVKAKYEKENAAGLAEARAAYEVTIKGIIDALPVPTDPTAPPTAPPDFPAFVFTPAPEMQDSVLSAQLSAESHALLQATDIIQASTFNEALQLLEKGLKAETATVFEKTQFYNTTVVMAGVQMPGAKSLPTERNGFMTKAFQVAPNTYKVAIALNAGGGTGSEVFAISHTSGNNHPLNFGNFESFEINGLSGVLVEVSGEDLLNANGEIEFSAQLHLGNGAGAGINTQSPTDGNTSSGKGGELPIDIQNADPSNGGPAPVPSSYGVHKLGVADYMRVEQTVCCYVPGEVSHIENIMAKEYKERSTRRLRRSEDTTTSETSSEKESQHDTSSADRFEMQQEVSKVIAENNSRAFGASASVGAGYSGEGYNINLNAAANYNTATNISKNESDRQAQTSAREVTEKATERMLEKVREERVSKVIDEYEEQNKHGFDNRGDSAEHVSGVYRWVDKIYHNQVVNYGKRLMYEFLIPQPAAFHKESIKLGPKNGIIAEEPCDPRIVATDPLVSHAVLDRYNYAHWAAQYNADVEAPPSQQLFIGKSFKWDGAAPQDGWEKFTANESIDIPEGYRSLNGGIVVIAHWDWDIHQEQKVGVSIGHTQFLDVNNDAKCGHAHTSGLIPLDSFEGSIPVSVNMINFRTVTVNASVELKLTDAAFEKWQIDTFQAIIDAYQKKLDTYNKDVAQAKADSDAKGTNPLFYRIIENDVLKKNCMEYLVGHTYLGGQNFIAGAGSLQSVSTLATAAMDSYASVARFMEQAFEWEIMSYNFFPFYWGANAQWPELYGNENDDPLFRSFLQAGMARVVTTVRPGFENAVMYYMATGQVWNGGTVPVIGDELYIGLAKDLQELGKPVGDSWETRVPTTLTVIQKDSVGLDAGGLPCNDDCDDIKYFFSSDKKLEAQTTVAATTGSGSTGGGSTHTVTTPPSLPI